MITIAFRFPAGRYHATPWGSQVNEGLVEWPPSPWRMLRAFISCGYTRLGWGTVSQSGAAPVPDAARHLILTLAGALPSYTLPPAAYAHSRHYLPIPGGKTTLVMDAWAAVDGELLVLWPVDLDADELNLLRELVASLNYLGRSESWVEGRVLSNAEPSSSADCVPLQPDAAGLPFNQDLISLMAPCPSDEYEQWRSERVSVPDWEGRKPTTKQLGDQKKAMNPYPADLLDALQWDTARWKSFGWSQPPGSQRIQYMRPRQKLTLRQGTGGGFLARVPQCDTVLLSLGSPSGNLSALPTLARTLPQAELVHKALVGRGGKSQNRIPTELSGCDLRHRPLQGHAHTHVLPMDLDADGHLDHILLWAPMGFGHAAMTAIRSLRRTWMKGGAEELRVALAGQGMRDQLEKWPEGLDGFIKPSRVWKTLTPFVPPRFVKKTGSNSPEGQIRAELASRHFPVPDQVEIHAYPGPGDLKEVQATHFRHFIRRRTRGGDPPPQDLGWFVRLTFSEPVQGPICLGYGGHFGLGLFLTDPK